MSRAPHWWHQPVTRRLRSSYVHGISRLGAAHVCDVLVQRGVLAEAHGRYLCAHTVIASVVMESVSAPRCHEVHRIIALALTNAGSSVGTLADPGAVERHAEAAGELAMAYSHAMLASQQCAERAAWNNASMCLELALSCATTEEQIADAEQAVAALRIQSGCSDPATDENVHLWARAPLRRLDVDLRPAKE